MIVRIDSERNSPSPAVSFSIFHITLSPSPPTPDVDREPVPQPVAKRGGGVYSLTIVAVTNCHKFHALKQHKFMIL